MSKLQHTAVEDIPKIHAELKAGFASGKTKSIAYRKYLLVQLMYMLKDNSQRFEDALKSDLGRPAHESQFFEVTSSIVEVKHTHAHIDQWVKPDKPAFSLNWAPMRPVIYKEPKGVVLIISPFNYPVFLTVPILASALAAGNAVVIKPSESTPATSALLEELIHQYLDTSLVRVVNGSIPETTQLLELPWGHILYTGGGRVGKIVSAAAAKTLTPVSLELGGKSPVFIDPKTDLKLAAKRILWGKVSNSGQTCVAPDYVLITPDVQDKFVAALKDAYNEFYPNGLTADADETYTKLVSPQAFKRVNGLLQNSKGKVVLGGDVDEARKFISPTVVTDVKPDDSLMSEEIFAPVLPIVLVKDVDEAIAYVNANDHPLSLYVFSQDNKFIEKVFRSTQSGSAIANETIIHPAAEGMPFGGIGPSGSGYHSGKYGFDMFTHLRSSLNAPGWLEFLVGFRYPPYTPQKLASMNKMLMPSLPARPKKAPSPFDVESKRTSLLKWLTFVLAFALAGGMLKPAKILQKIGF